MKNIQYDVIVIGGGITGAGVVREAAMRGLARHLKGDEDSWGIAGLIHDADYEVTKDNAKKEHKKR